MIRLSTFSIAAYDSEINAWGVAVASKFLGVGNAVPWARSGAGAVATQSYANTSYGPRGLQMMEDGMSAEEALNNLISSDSESERRQVGIVDPSGGSATFTGSECYEWAGGLTGPGYAIQGNILTGENVIKAMEKAFLETDSSFMWRLYESLLAGDRAGGDRRGRQSASILIVKHKSGYGGFNDRWIDYRVDDHQDPVIRLKDLLIQYELYFDTSEEVEKIKLEGEALITLQKISSKLGFYQGDSHGILDQRTKSSIRDFMGNENFEERMDLENGTIDKPVLDYLIKKFSE